MREPELHQLVGEHVIEGAEAELRAVGVDVIVIGHRDTGLVGPGYAHAVEQRMQDAEADLHAMKRHAARDEALHGAFDEMRHRLVGDARGDDRGGDVRLGADVAVLHRPFIEGRRGDFETVAPRQGRKDCLPSGSSPRAGKPGQ
jgi:hypothetical protein